MPYRWMLFVLKFALALLGVCAVLLFFIQGGMIYFPRAYEEGDLVAFRRSGGSELAFETGEGKQVAYYLPPQGVPSATPESIWLICGGNGALALDYLDAAVRAGREQGYLFIDYPGYGQCEGSPTPRSAAATVEGAVTSLAGHLGTTPEDLKPRLSAFGHSLGAAVVLRAAADMELRRAVAVAPFTSMMDLARKQVGFPLCQVLRHRYDNRASLRKIAASGGRVTLFHGSADEEVSVENSRALAVEFPETVKYHEIEGGDHNALIDTIGAALAEAMKPGARSAE